MSNQTPCFTFRLPDWLRAKIEDYANKHDLKLSEAIIKILTDKLGT